MTKPIYTTSKCYGITFEAYMRLSGEKGSILVWLVRLCVSPATNEPKETVI